MNAYVFVDMENDGQFSFNANGTDQSGTDVMSFSFYSGDPATDNSGVNSEGTALTGQNRNTMTLPSFAAPSDAGVYRIRFKMDWNSVDPGGQLAVGNNAGILGNGGAIVDAMLVVEAKDTGIESAQAQPKQAPFYDLSGRRLQQAPAAGVYIFQNRKYVK